MLRESNSQRSATKAYHCAYFLSPRLREAPTEDQAQVLHLRSLQAYSTVLMSRAAMHPRTPEGLGRSRATIHTAYDIRVSRSVSIVHKNVVGYLCQPDNCTSWRLVSGNAKLERPKHTTTMSTERYSRRCRCHHSLAIVEEAGSSKKSWRNGGNLRV